MRVLSKFFAVLVLACVFIAGCAPPIMCGKVVSKQFVPAHDENSFMTVGDVTVPITDHIPDYWYVTFGNKAEDGRYYERRVSVPKERYDKLKEGDWFAMKE
jgi:hypothetical protein